MRRLPWVLLVIAVLMSVCTAVNLPAAPASAKTIRTCHSSGVYFSDPRTYATQAIDINLVIGCVNRARRGDTIRISTYTCDSMRVAQALVRAHQRGVHVRLIVDHHLRHSDAMKLLFRKIGHNIHAKSWIKACRGSCLGRGHGTVHSKFYLFSGHHKHITMIGSANLSLFGIHHQWNELYATRNKGLHNALAGLFNRMKYDRPAAGHTYTHGPYQLITYPRSAKKSKDPVIRLLKTIGCRAARGYGSHGHTVISINMHAWWGKRGADIARQVARLHRHGCRIRIITGEAFGANVGRITGKIPRTRYVPTGDVPYTHMKALGIRGHVGHDWKAQVVLTGSRNWVSGSNKRDETTLRIKSAAVYWAYQRQFNRMWRIDRQH